MASSSSEAPPPEFPRVLLAIVTEGQTTLSLQCLTSVLNFQATLMTMPPETQFAAELAYVKTLNDALTVLHRDKQFVGAYVVGRDNGVDPEFAARAYASGLPLVACAMPLPQIFWDRVKAAVVDPAEDSQYAGVRYNLDVDEAAIPKKGHARVKAARKLDVLFVRRGVVDAIAIKHPGVVTDGACDFAFDGVRDGRFVDGVSRFLNLYGGEVWTDLDHQGTCSGPVEFAGTVGARAVLR